MRKVLFVIGAVIGSFLLGTNFNIEVNFGLDDESVIWTWVRMYQRTRRWMKGQRTPKPAPKPAPRPVQQSNPFGSSPVGLGQRPSGAPPAGGPSRPVGGPSSPAGGPSSPFGQRPSALTGTPPRSSVAFGGSGHPTRPLPEGGEKGAVWSPRDSRWYPPGAIVNQMGGVAYPVAPHQRPLREWDFAKANWSSPSDGKSQNSFAPKPFKGNMFPTREEGKLTWGRGYNSPCDGDDDEIEDDDEE